MYVRRLGDGNFLTNMILGYEQCPAPGCARETGKANRGCEQCEGSGKVVGQTAECPSCKGTKKQSCPLCRGTGRMSTGRKDGAPSDSNAPYCASCNGIGRKLEREPQAWNDYVLGTMEGFTVLGPIHDAGLSENETHQRSDGRAPASRTGRRVRKPDASDRKKIGEAHEQD